MGAGIGGSKDIQAAWNKMGTLEAEAAVRRVGLIRHDMSGPWIRLSSEIFKSSYLGLENRDFRFS